MSTVRILFAAVLACGAALPAAAAWQPTKPVEFIVTSGPGGGTDNFARVVQSIVAKYKFIEQPTVVQNKGGGSGAEGYVYAKTAAGDPYKLTFGTNNEYLLPLVSKLAWKGEDLTPVAAMVLDEFILWNNASSEYKDAKSFIEAAKAKPGTFKMGGSQSKDTDQTLTSMIATATGAKFIYIPFKSGSEAAVQLAGGHIDGNVNNPNENIGQWKAGLVRPLCVFSPAPLPASGKVAGEMGWSDIPPCNKSGIAIDQYQQPRTVWLPGKAPDEAVAFYVDVMRKVRETPEWKEYIQRTSQTDKFLSGPELKSFIADDEAKARKVFQAEGWVVQ
jgi:putative tricarboxylic transport membrane protein